ncbi:MAG: ParB/RepB/Spo0J family partition protein, partial [Defluviitaleaceae bacterium]|nr:ParB/RepB/Spo0J family partition protein [Defluviitaleaceae bacterium]
RDQPRKHFDEESLAELASSLAEYGVVQPVLVKAEDGYYSLIAGERRWRAARIAKLTTIPAIVRDYSPIESLQIALVENIQREDLNPIEEALCYKRLAEEFFYTQESIAQKVGKSRHAVSNAMSLLSLDPRVQNMLAEGRLSPAHGRALLSVPNTAAQTAMAERVSSEDLSVRETERIIKTEPAKPKKPTPPQSPEYARIENELKSLFGTRVRIQDSKPGEESGGKIEIHYYSPDELDRIIGLLKGDNRK